jgi:hypothetical protein
MATGRTNDGFGFAVARWLATAFASQQHPLHHLPPPGAAGVEQRALRDWGLAGERMRLQRMHGHPVSSFRTVWLV